VSPNRTEQRSSPQVPSTPAASETLRLASAPGEDAAPAKEEKISPFWRIFGGTLLSIATLVIITVCQQFNSQLNELRSELNHLNVDLRKELARLCEGQGELVKKDEFSTRMRSVWDSMKELQADRATLTAVKERCAILQDLYRAGVEERKELGQELARLREGRAGEEERRELAREVQRLRERLAALEGRQGAAPAVKPAVHREE
jgi:hypothetical protein